MCRILFDSLKLIVSNEDNGLETETDIDEKSDWDELDDEGLQEHLIDLAWLGDDNPINEDWLPTNLQKKGQQHEKNKKGMALTHYLAKSECVFSTRQRVQERSRCWEQIKENPGTILQAYEGPNLTHKFWLLTSNHSTCKTFTTTRITLTQPHQ